MKKKIINHSTTITFIIMAILFSISFAILIPIIFRPFYYCSIKILDIEGQSGYSYAEIKEAFESTTNNRMEVLSAIVALKELKEPCDVTLTSDSQYLVKAFNENWIDTWIKKDFRRGKTDEVKNIDLWEELIELTKKHDVHFVWVKGHADNIENERCDELANEAISEMQKSIK